MKHPNPDILLYIAMADAYAAALEYVRPERHRDLCEDVLALTRYRVHPTHEHQAGAYTDDAEMSIANATVLIENTAPYTPLMFADAWVAEFHRGGRRKGYAKAFQEFLESVTSGQDFLNRIRPTSTKNGAAMRAVPFGVLRSVPDVLEAATLQASITHDTTGGRFSARAVALMSHYALYEEGPLRELPKYLDANLPDEDLRLFRFILERRWGGGPVATRARMPVAVTTAHAVLDLVANGHSLIHMMKMLLRWGGDTDSVAAITWGIASARFRQERLPEFMEHALEQGSPATGPIRLRDVGAKLMNTFV